MKSCADPDVGARYSASGAALDLAIQKQVNKKRVSNCKKGLIKHSFSKKLENMLPRNVRMKKGMKKAMKKAIYVGSYNKVNVRAPFVNLTKAGVVKVGLSLKVPYELTYSCYEGDGISCGTCATCIDRQKAFYENGVIDPVPYKVRLKKE